MASLSISKAWDEARAVLARDGGLIVPVALVFFALPNILFQTLAIPADFVAKAQTGALTRADFGAWIYWSIPVALLNTIGVLAISALALQRGLSVGEALGGGARRLPALLGAWFLAIIVPSLVGGFAIGLAAVVSPGLAVLLNFAFVLVFIVLLVRLSLVSSPVAVAERGGPVALLKRSWVLTRGQFWRLLGLLLLFGILFGVISIAANAVVGIVIFLASGGEMSATGMLVAQIISGIISAVLVLVLYVILARVYAILTSAPDDVRP